MKLLLISCIFALNIFSIKTKELLLVGFRDFKNETKNNKINFSFDILFKKLESFSNYEFLYWNITISNGTLDKNIELKCTEKAGKLHDDLYYACENSIDLNNIQKINASKKFLFSNKTMNFTFDDEILESSKILESIDNIQNQTGKLDYSTFYLKNIANSKNSFTLYGNIAENLTGQVASFNSGEEIYKLTINENQINFIANKYIDEHLNGKICKIEPSYEDKYILIYMNETGIKDLAYYVNPDSKLFVEVIGAGNFTQINKNNAKGNLFLRGSPELLKSLRRYIKFTANAIYNGRKLRNLENTQIINAIGEKNNSQSNENIVVYNVNYTDFTDSSFIALKPANNFDFSDDKGFENPEKQITKGVNQNINLSDSNTELPEVIKLKESGEQVKYNPSSFEIEFNTTETLKLSSNESIFRYPSQIGSDVMEEINCILYNRANINDYYKILCSTRKSIHAILRDVSIIIKPQISSRLRILQTNTNNYKTLLFPSNADEIINYEYSAKTHDYFRTSKSKGLSAGAIVAIILSSIAALVAVGLVFFFLRKNQTPPVIKNQPDFNVINSTSNINN